MFKHIKFAQLPVTNQARALAFYTEKLGLHVVTDADFQGGWRWIELQVGASDTRLLFTQRAGERPSEMPDLNLVADDVRASYETLKARGVEFTQQPTEAPWNPGHTFAVFRDSENNLVLIGSE